MEILKVLLVVVEVVSCLLLVGVILLQKSKSEGLGLAFGSGMGETLFGSRAGNVLTKITVTLGLVFLGTTAILGILFTRSHETSIIDQRTAPLPMSAPAQAPAEAPAQISDAPLAPAAPLVSAPSAAAPTLMPGASLESQGPEAAPAAEPAAP
jgi:preprotein translocase subunit SecG